MVEAYLYDGPFESKYLATESQIFRSALHELSCNDQHAYSLFTGFIELFQNIAHHAETSRLSICSSINASIGLTLPAQNEYKLSARNLVSREQEYVLIGKLSSLDNLRKAKGSLALGLYLIKMVSKGPLIYNFQDSSQPDLRIFNLSVNC
jgi:hypothetical protein